MQQSHSRDGIQGRPSDTDDERWSVLESRSEEAGLKCVVSTVDGTDFKIGLVHLQEQGSDRLPLLVWRQNIGRVLDIEFERFRLVGRYHAIHSPASASIEAFIEPAVGPGPVDKVIEQAFKGATAGEEQIKRVVLQGEGVEMALGPPSKELLALAGEERGNFRGAKGTSLLITGPSTKGPGSAKKYLETLSDALFFECDLKFHQPLVLSRSNPVRLPLGAAEPEGQLTFPGSEFDREPMSLYWYGRGATGLPLLEFFAYYQVLEFYFEQHVDADGRRRIAQVLKHPGFSPHNERHIVKVLRAAGRGSNSRRTERDQLLTTLRACSDVEEIRDFIGEDDERREFFEEALPRLTEHTVRVGDSDLLQQVADRIYDIRCRIVHTKERGGGGGDSVELLLPDSPEADLLDKDIDLLRLIARQALVFASRPMSAQTGS